MKILYLIDVSGYLFKAYYAIRNMSNAQGLPTNAIYGFARSLFKLFKDFPIEYVVAIFDGPNNKASRLAIYPEYKAHRQPCPEDLIPQIEWAKELCSSLGIPVLMIDGHEADDAIGACACWAKNHFEAIFVCSQDKDLFQLITDQIHILNTHKNNEIIDEQKLQELLGILPCQVIDYLAIMGDTSDNIPGVKGLGPKAAQTLLSTYSSLDEIYTHIDQITPEKRRQALIEHQEEVYLSQKLVQLQTDISIPQELSFYQKQDTNLEASSQLLQALNFHSLFQDLNLLFGNNPVSHSDDNDKESHYVLVNEVNALQEVISLLQTQKEICIDIESTGLRPMQDALVGIGIGYSSDTIWYIPFNGNISKKNVIDALNTLFSTPHLACYGHNIKFDILLLLQHGIQKPAICFDTMIASYVLNAHSHEHSLEHLALEYFHKPKMPIKELIGTGKEAITMNEVALDKVTQYCCRDVEITIHLKEILEKQIYERKLEKIFYEMEIPLIDVLLTMEQNGIYVDIHILQEMKKQVVDALEEEKQKIFDLAEENFNLSSPKQLSFILFEKLQIHPPKKIATGFSTNMEVLELLAENYPIAKHIINFRLLEKLRSTYLEALPKEIHPQTHRIHSTFNQSMTATGRLSSHQPNLQNIPIRSELGRDIRAAFCPEQPGWSYLSADYSQIELRILAHLSEDTKLVEAFKTGKDIHKQTASEIFDIPLDQVSSQQRQQAKTINFGIIYGQQAFGLAQQLGISVSEAKKFIETYFHKYQGVYQYIQNTIEKARKELVTYTLLGRQRKIPEIAGSNKILKQAAERLAVNTPIQGTQADLIKMAMLHIHEELILKKLKSKILLQIHDELLFEVPDTELDTLSSIVKKQMQEVIFLKVPLIVDIHVGKNWKEC